MQIPSRGAAGMDRVVVAGQKTGAAEANGPSAESAVAVIANVVRQVLRRHDSPADGAVSHAPTTSRTTESSPALAHVVGQQLYLAGSLIHNAAAGVVGGRKPDGVVNPDLSRAEATHYREMGKLGKDAYQESGAPEGYTRVSAGDLKKMGLDPKAFDQDAKSGMTAVLYKNDETGKYTLAFRATESGNRHDRVADWVQTNLAQGLGLIPKQYQEAAKLAGDVKAALGDDVELTGYSLGGGLANYAAVSNNLDFTIFNAAPLSKTAERNLSDELAAYDGHGVVINDTYDPLTNPGRNMTDEGLGGKHLGYDKLIWIDDGKPPEGFKDVIASHSLDTRINPYLESQIQEAA